MKAFTFYVLIVLKTLVRSSPDNVTINFIISFIKNEHQPTHFMFELCWRKYDQLTLVKELAKIGVISCTRIESSYYLDQSMLFLLDFDCPDAEDKLSKAISKKLYKSPFRWLLVSNSSNDVISRPVIQEAPFLPDSDVVLAERDGDGYRMLEIYRISMQYPIQSTLRGHYNGVLEDVRPFRALFRRRKDLMGHPLTMANVIQDSNKTQYHLEHENRLEREYDFITRVSWITVRLGFLMLNATPQYFISYRWGYQVNGTWSGMVRDLKLGRADVGANIFMTLPRLREVAYTDNLAPVKALFVFRQPPLPSVTNIFTLPFSTGVWVAVVVCTLAVAIGLTITSRWEAKQREEHVTTQMDGSLGDALLMAMSAVSQQSCELNPKRAPGRILMLIMFVTLMATYAAYSANIVVLLQAPSTSIRTLAQLAHSKLTLAANDVDYNHFLFKIYKDDDPVRNLIYRKIESENNKKKQFYELNDGIERIRQGHFAFHSIVEPVYRRIEDTFLEHEKCDLMEVDFLNGFDAHIPVQKNSPYLELLRVVFKQVRESGILSIWTRRMQTPKPKCSHQVSAFSSVGLTDLAPVIIMMLYGATMSLLILILELLVYRVYVSVQTYGDQVAYLKTPISLQISNDVIL